ncbi:MAG: HEAT repeat domain-containing protein [Pirellulaceae bacterium]
MLHCGSGQTFGGDRADGRRLLAIALVLVGAAVITPAALGDVFVLNGGGQVRGVWLNPSEREPAVYEIKTEQGGQLQLARDHVRERIPERTDEVEYRRIAPQYGESVEEQWKLAEWCREHNLPSQREEHLRRILRLDSDHGAARRGLGYSHIGGRWVTREGWVEEKGFEYYSGAYRTPQEVAILKRRQAEEDAQRKWLMRLMQLREALAGDDPYAARDEILAVRDAEALPALAQMIRRDPNPRVKLVYLEAMRNIGGFPAAKALVEVSLNDPDPEVFYESLEQIADLNPKSIAKPFVDALKDENNVRVNRAGFALGRLEQRAAMGPLIDALVTTHTIVLKSGQGPDTVTTTFTRPPPGAASPTLCRDRGVLSGLSAGDQTKVIPMRVNNQEVLTALVKLSGGVTFGYDQQAWRNWHEQQKRVDAVKETRLR